MKDESLDYILKILKEEKVENDPDFNEVIGFLINHRIAGLFYSKIKKLQIKVPKKVEKILQENFKSQKRRVVYLRNTIKEISNYFLANKIEHVLLKGSILSNDPQNEIYLDGERSSNDIDILVKQSGISKVCEALTNLGYVQGEYNENTKQIKLYDRYELIYRRMNRGEIASFIKKTGDDEIPYIEIDINFSLGNTPNDELKLLNDMIDTRIIQRGKVELSSLNSEMFFLHLIMHQYKESTLYFMVERNKDLDLYKLLDIYYLIKKNKVDLSKIKELANYYNISKKVGTVINQVGEILNDEEIKIIASSFTYEIPKVIDYQNKKVYEWTVSLKDRIKEFSTIKYLKEDISNANES